ncbi:tyrosine-type recombinase/integrase [Pseudomonas sp. NFIX28]|uniref:tyrosine-type recombinase/integrase n=1 Tax=Pseudomonas sp. NFIX28 TaxID=1566235 RepID=UPI00089D99C5|nr:tyrosine-type recombinase/integrase [Pseudomonas sp. NFIX28]SDZ25583.1 Phage integrase family protein [Pseudomonas sp. NFIX28]
MPIQIRWQLNEGFHIPIPYNIERNIIQTEIIDYAIFLERQENLSHQYIKNELFHISVFENFASNQNIELIDVTNTLIRDFRDNDYNRLLTTGISSSKSIKSVVNLRLRRIYHFYTWMQTHSSLCNLIGRYDCQIHSSLPEYFLRRTVDHRDKELFPLCFRNIGSASKHTTKYEASEKNRQALENIFLDHPTPYIGQRNSLILEIANLTGFRRSSINSLLCSQFSDKLINTAEDDFILVSPSHQKYGYTLSFRVPILLAYRINHFINTFRKDLLQAIDTNNATTQDRIFLSARTGNPLNNQTISEIFHDAIAKLNIKQTRVGIHSLRRKFTNDRITEEILTRAELGLDTSTTSIESSLSLLLGQTSPASVRPYISRRQILEIERAREIRRQNMESLQNENASLRAELLRLRAEITLLKNDSSAL